MLLSFTSLLPRETIFRHMQVHIPHTCTEPPPTHPSFVLQETMKAPAYIWRFRRLKFSLYSNRSISDVRGGGLSMRTFRALRGAKLISVMLRHSCTWMARSSGQSSPNILKNKDIRHFKHLNLYVSIIFYFLKFIFPEF